MFELAEVEIPSLHWLELYVIGSSFYKFSIAEDITASSLKPVLLWLKEEILINLDCYYQHKHLLWLKREGGKAFV